MANSEIRISAEEEIRGQLPEVGFFKEKNLNNFRKQKLRLSSGGEFEFDAVDGGRKAAVCISTTKGVTHRKDVQSGTLNKIYKDMYFLLMAENINHRVVVFSEKSAYDVFCKQQKKKRVHPKIALLHVPLSNETQTQIEGANKEASTENRKQ